MIKTCLTMVCILLTFGTFAQERPIKIEDVKQGNRLLLYAINENEQDFDVLLTVEGTGFRQPKGKPRLVRVPATSKVNVKSLIIERGKTPNFTFKLEANDSLSRRALKKPFEIIKIAPKRPILIYTTDNCTSCESMLADLNASIYKYRTKVLNEEVKTKEYLEKVFSKSTTPLSTITNPIVVVGGKYYGEIATYEALMELVNAVE